MFEVSLIVQHVVCNTAGGSYRRLAQNAIKHGIHSLDRSILALDLFQVGGRGVIFSFFYLMH